MKQFLFITIFLFVTTISYGETSGCPHHEKHSKDKQGVNERGDQEMGFDHSKTKHHFRLLQTGGSIEVLVNDPSDSLSLESIRKHLKEISKLFAAGDFQKPQTIHDQVPPGVPVMIRMKETIQYAYEDADRGGRVRISTQNREALQAIHEFLRFQITDHETGDSLEVQ